MPPLKIVFVRRQINFDLIQVWSLTNLLRAPTLIAILLPLPVTSFSQTFTATSMSATHPVPGAVTPAPAEAFVESIGVNVHCENASSAYRTKYETAKYLLAEIGIRFVRTGGTNSFCISSTQDLYRSLGIKTDFLILPYLGNGIDADFWASPSAQHLAPFLKNTVGTAPIASIEITNEVDSFSSYYRWHPNDKTSLVNSATAANGWGTYGPAIESAAYKIMKGDPVLSSIPVYGPSLGYFANGFANGSMARSVDYGTMHPYPYAGNTMSFPTPYGGIQKYFWQSNQPSVNIDEFPYAFKAFQPAFSSTAPGNVPAPMVATETGYYTGSSKRSVSQSTQAKYIPRLLAEYFRHGISKTYLYDFIDDGPDLTNSEDNYGLVTVSLSRKPAFVALKSLIALLEDAANANVLTPLDYTLSVRPVGKYTRTNYVHDLLLEKSDGTYYLILWHEVSSAALADSKGNLYVGTAKDIAPPALSTTISLPANVTSALLYTYGPDWRLVKSSLRIEQHRLVVSATDQISVIELSRKRIR